ncbi:hypothetical protein TNCV_2422141 [Trichonephila clavipes]|nr:hypothetical protein TNCV_2422141 [Trichonephila clavipes]
MVWRLVRWMSTHYRPRRSDCGSGLRSPLPIALMLFLTCYNLALGPLKTHRLDGMVHDKSIEATCPPVGEATKLREVCQFKCRPHNITMLRCYEVLR